MRNFLLCRKNILIYNDSFVVARELKKHFNIKLILTDMIENLNLKKFTTSTS